MRILALPACLGGLTPGVSASFQEQTLVSRLSRYLSVASTLIVMVDAVDTFRVSRDVEFTLDNKLIHPKLFRGVIHYIQYQRPIIPVWRTKWANLTGGHFTRA